MIILPTFPSVNRQIPHNKKKPRTNKLPVVSIVRQCLPMFKNSVRNPIKFLEDTATMIHRTEKEKWHFFAQKQISSSGRLRSSLHIEFLKSSSLERANSNSNISIFDWAVSEFDGYLFVNEIFIFIVIPITVGSVTWETLIVPLRPIYDIPLLECGLNINT